MYSLASSVKDQIRLHKGLFFVSLVFFVFPIGFFALGLGAYRYDTSILETGDRVTGTVLFKKVDSDPEDGDRYQVVYTFPHKLRLDSENRFTGRHELPKELWDKLSRGSDIEIVYDPHNPDRNFPVNGGGVTSFLLIGFMGLICLVPILVSLLVFYGIFVNLAYRIYEISKRGILDSAEVSEIGIIQQDADSENGRLFRFKTSQGKLYELHDTVRDKDLDSLNIGASIRVIVDEDHLEKAVLLLSNNQRYLLDRPDSV